MIRETRVGDALHVTIDRPEAANSLTIGMLADLLDVVRGVESSDVRAVVLTGAAPKQPGDVGRAAFSAGADLAGIREFGTSGMDPVERGRDLGRLGTRLTAAIESSPVPVIAAVDGPAFGGGLELALACDVIIATARSRFALPEARIGLIPGFGGCARLPRAVGRPLAREMILTGRALDAHEAHRHGLVGTVVTGREELTTAVAEVLASVRSSSPAAISVAKAVLAAGNDDDDLDFVNEAQGYAVAFERGQWREGIDAFLDKREASF